jgi:glycerol-3-phosphate dehydrogenase (NAD(P)+)
MKIAVVGAGSWGTTLSQLFALRGDSVSLWARRGELAQQMSRTRKNPDYMSKIVLDERIAPITSDLGQALEGAEVVLLAVPTSGFRDVMMEMSRTLNQPIPLVSTAKGFELHSFKTMTEVAIEVMGESWRDRVCVLSGPNIASEIADGLPAATALACAHEPTAQMVRDLLNGPQLRFYSSTDVVGVEYGGAVKNIIAIAAGICDGMNLGNNAKAALMTRGIAEMTRLGLAAGAKAETFAGLAGVGDLLVTCMSPHSRNRTLGEAIAQGMTLEEVEAKTPMVAEGVNAARAARELSERMEVSMPITLEVNRVLFEGKTPADAVGDLMGRDAKDEAASI